MSIFVEMLRYEIITTISKNVDDVNPAILQVGSKSNALCSFCNDDAMKLESVSFDPNIQILPGVGVSADSLGILIDVVGELYPSADGKGVDGKIGFVSSGELPPPMRLLPEQALRSSLSTINKTIANFAISSFQKGARTKFREFLKAAEMSR